MVNLDNLFTYMKNKKITANQLSQATGISSGNISDWKSKRSMPSAPKLVAIADYLNCSIDYLLGRSDVVELNLPAQASNKPRLANSAQAQSIMFSLYDQPASAGTGNWLDNDVSMTYVGVRKTTVTANADFLIRIAGDSMQPRYCNGDIVAIKKSPTISRGEIGIFIVNGDVYIKQMGDGQLISLNDNYKNIFFCADDDVRCAGVVLGIANIV